jgi:outer membrane protein assembly factor BamB
VVTPIYCGVFVAFLVLTGLGGRPVYASTQAGSVEVPRTRSAVRARKEKLPPPGPIRILPADEVWFRQFDVPPATGGLMDAERVYVPLRTNGLQVLSRKTGGLIWAEPVDITQPPHLEDDLVLLTLPDSLRALDRVTGQRQWAIALDRPLIAPLTSAGGVVLAFTDKGELMALRPQSGEVVWRQTFGADSKFAPAFLAPSLAVVSLTDGRVVALDASNGTIQWEQKLPGVLSAPAVGRDRVFVGSTNNFFYALDAENGREEWKWRTGGDVMGAAVDKDRVYFVSLDNVLRAVNRGNGNQLWKVAIPTRPALPPIAFDDIVVLMGVAPQVDAYNGKTGEALGSLTASAELEGAALVDLDPEPFAIAVVTLTRDGRVTALRPTALTFPDPPLTPILKLPGRELPADRLPRPTRQ